MSPDSQSTRKSTRRPSVKPPRSVRPEAWERLEGQGVEVDDGMKTASSGWSEESRKAQRKADESRRDNEGTRPDGKPLRSPQTADDDVNKAPGGVGGQGTRADGRTRAPDTPVESPSARTLVNKSQYT